jgi:anti-sigma B factor antagonist
MAYRAVIIKTLPERLDSNELPAFRQAMQSVIDSDQPQVVLDMSAVKYLGSAGIENLLHCLSVVVRRDGELKLAALSPQAASLLSLTRVDRFFEVFPTVEEAVNTFDSFTADANAVTEPWNSFSVGAKASAVQD